MDIREKYRDRVIRFANDRDTVVSEHIIGIMVSIMATRDGNSYPGGSFVEAVVNNDLYNAMSRADLECRNHLFLLTMCNMNCYL